MKSVVDSKLTVTVFVDFTDILFCLLNHFSQACRERGLFAVKPTVENKGKCVFG